MRNEALRKRYWALRDVTGALRGVTERYGSVVEALRGAGPHLAGGRPGPRA